MQEIGLRLGRIVDSQTVALSNDDLELAVPTFAHDVACQITRHKTL